MMAPAQCRAARGLVGWSQAELAEAAKVGVTTVRNFERGATAPTRATLDVMRRALEAAGVEFTARGVELREQAPLAEG
jgi:transcriptional regulator with XRE-family HTH domain